MVLKLLNLTGMMDLNLCQKASKMRKMKKKNEEMQKRKKEK